MADAEVVQRRLTQIDRRVAALRAVAERGLDTYVADPGLQAQAERHLQVAIQAAIDTAMHILADDMAVAPDDYGTAFMALADAGVLPPELGERLRLAAGLRNVLVHAYADVDPRRVWEHLRNLDDLVALAGHVQSYLDSAAS